MCRLCTLIARRNRLAVAVPFGLGMRRNVCLFPLRRQLSPLRLVVTQERSGAGLSPTIIQTTGLLGLNALDGDTPSSPILPACAVVALRASRRPRGTLTVIGRDGWPPQAEQTEIRDLLS